MNFGSSAAGLKFCSSGKYLFPLLSVLVSIFLFFGNAHAVIPLVTDDTGTQGRGKFQLELFGEYAHDREESITNRGTAFLVTLSYGIVDPVDIILSIPPSILAIGGFGFEDE